MFSTPAWMRRSLLVFVALFPAAAVALEDSLFTSSVSYCQPPTTVLIEQFDIAYFASNASVSFNISAATEQAMNISANIQLNVYGMKPVNFSLDVCSILNHALCPLPAYNFTGADSITLPSTVDVASHLPGIAYKIPDLEAFAQLTLTDTSTNEVVACVQATLSNGWSARQNAVEWATGGLALFALFSAALHTATPGSLAPVRLLDLMSLLQYIAATGMLALNFPSVYRAFTLNFAWALGLFRASNIQGTINDMRAHTGGGLADSTGNAVGLVNRLLSPYNDASLAVFAAPRDLLARLNTLPRVVLPAAGTPVRRAQELIASAGVVQTVTKQSSNVLDAGAPIYVNMFGITTANAFMTVFLVTLILAAIAIGVFGLACGIVYALARRSHSVDQFKQSVPLYARAWALRLNLVIFFPIAVFAFYQWTLKDSWASVLLSVLSLLAVLAGIAIPSFVLIRGMRRSTANILKPHADANGALYQGYREPRWYTFGPVLLATLVRALLIAFAQGSALVQIALLLVVELLLFGTLLVLRPAHTRRGDVLQGFLAGARVVGAGAMLAFVPSLGVQPIPRVAIGIVLAVLFSICVLVTALSIVRHLGVFALFRRGPRRQGTLAPLMTEKASPSKENAPTLSGSTPFGDSPAASSFDGHFFPHSGQQSQSPTLASRTELV